jgi:hypothetical protein
MDEYLVYDFTNNKDERFFTYDISNYIDNNKYVYIKIADLPSHPIGCYIENNRNSFNFDYNNKTLDEILEFEKTIKYYFVYNKDKAIRDNSVIMDKIREDRNKLLKLSDILILEDYPFSYKNELKIYRTYLRDLPNKIEEQGIFNYYSINNRKLYTIDKFEYVDLNNYL